MNALPEPAAVARRFWPAVAVLAAALGGLGVILWIAANWQDFGRMGRFGLLQGAIVAMCAAAVAKPNLRAPFALAAMLCVGGLFAYFGQTYQTGADAWQLFALWAVLALPLCLGTRSDVLWAPWALVVSVAISLWIHTHIGRGWRVRSDDIGVHAVGWFACALLLVALGGWLRRFTGAGLWSLRTAGTLTVTLLTVTAIGALFADKLPPQYVLALLLFGAAAIVLAQPAWFDVFLLSAVALALDTLIVGGLTRALFKSHTHGDPIGELMLIGLVAAGLLAISVSFILKLARRHG